MLLPQVTNGNCWFFGYFSGKNDGAKVTLEFVRAYIDDLLCITKGTLEDHLAKLESVLSRLQDANLKVNARKSNFCAIETEYLGYILSRDGIKPQPKKVQSILALTHPKMSKTSTDFLAWYNTIKVFGQDAAKCLPHS